MKLGFFHDSTFVKSNNKYYTKGQVNAEFLQKYIDAFNKQLIATVRVEHNINNTNITEKNLINNANIIEVNKNYSNVRKQVSRALKECDYAIIRMPSIIGIFACAEAKRKKIPYLIEMVGCPREALWYHGGLKFKICAPIITIINKIELRKAKDVIYVTKKFLQKRYRTNGNSISCSDVNLPELKKDILEFRITNIDNKKDNVYKLGLIGSLDVDYKGHLLAIKGLATLKDKINFELHFLGSGNKERWIKIAKKYQINDKIFFDGTLPHIEVFNWIDNLDIYLILSKTEGLPRALIEAMSRACPCIGTNVGGIPELLNKESIINKKDFINLSEKIYELICNKDKRKQLAKDNFERVSEYQEKELDKVRIKYYKEIIARIENEKSITCSK